MQRGALRRPGLRGFEGSGGLGFRDLEGHGVKFGCVASGL